jgi:hypothetical protein
VRWTNCEPAGPAGPKVLADAIDALALPKANNPHDLLRALVNVPAAAISWKERL